MGSYKTHLHERTCVLGCVRKSTQLPDTQINVLGPPSDSADSVSICNSITLLHPRWYSELGTSHEPLAAYESRQPAAHTEASQPGSSAWLHRASRQTSAVYMHP